MTKRDENNLTDDELLQMWKDGEPVEIAQPPPEQEPVIDNDGSPVRSQRSPHRKV